MFVMFSLATSMVRAGYWLSRWLKGIRPNVKGNCVVLFEVEQFVRNLYLLWDCVLSDIFMCGCGGFPLGRSLDCRLSSWLRFVFLNPVVPGNEMRIP